MVLLFILLALDAVVLVGWIFYDWNAWLVFGAMIMLHVAENWLRSERGW